MDENNNFSPIPEQDAPVAQPIENAQPVQAPVEQPVYVQPPVQPPVQAPAQPVYIDSAAQAPVQQPVQVPAQPVYIDPAAQAPVQQPVQVPAQPVYIDPAAQAPIQQPVQAPAQPVYIDPAAQAPVQQPVYTQQPAYAQQPQGVSPKSRRLALIFAIVFGPLGINRFYLGNVDVARFVLTLVGYTVLCFSAFIVPFFIGSGLLVYPTICMVKDIIATAKGTMTDGQGLAVKNW